MTFVILCPKHTKSEYSRVQGYDAVLFGKQLWHHIIKSRIFIGTAVGTSILAYKYHLMTMLVYTKLILWNLSFPYGDGLMSSGIHISEEPAVFIINSDTGAACSSVHRLHGITAQRLVANLMLWVTVVGTSVSEW